MMKKLKKDVCYANKMLAEHNLVLFTWGNVSAIDRKKGVVAIKPSGVRYQDLKPEMIVLLDLDGNVLEGNLKPSSDTWTHLEIYKKFIHVNAIVHTHSENATVFAQANSPIRCFGTTHADYFYGDIPVIPKIPKFAIDKNYERNTGVAICNYFFKNKIDPKKMGACLVSGHGPFVWAKDLMAVIHNSVVLENIAKMNLKTLLVNNSSKTLHQDLLNKHYLRKHGKNKYYGQ